MASWSTWRGGGDLLAPGRNHVEVSAVVEGVSALGLSASSNGDARAPVVLGVETATGDVRWSTALVEATDLNFGSPAVIDGAVAFESTPTHIGAEVNFAHLVDLGDGSIRWALALGDAKGFRSAPIIANGRYLHLPSRPEAVTVDAMVGTHLWSRPADGGDGAALGLVDGELWMATPEGLLAQVDAATGAVARDLWSPVAEPHWLMDLGSGLMVVASATELDVIDGSGRGRLSHRWATYLTDAPIVAPGVVVVATADGTVAAYAVRAVPPGQESDPSTETSTTDAGGDVCPPLTGSEPQVGGYFVSAVPPGFAVVGTSERTSTGNLDEGGESTATLQLVDPAGRQIEVVEFGSYNPADYLSRAHLDGRRQPVAVPRCGAGESAVDSMAEWSESGGEVLVGGQDWEYGGYLVVGGPDVTLDEVLVVAAGLRTG